MKKVYLALIGAALGFQTSVSAQQNPLINSPAVSPNGEKIAFNYQGDIWTSNADGSDLNRITIHEANDANPMWSADGSKLVFSSNRFGNNDLFAVNAEGGLPDRITFHSASDIATDVTADGKIVFSTSRNFRQLERESEFHVINMDGGTPFRILNTTGFDARYSPDGKHIVFTKGSCRIEREAYRGPANRDIWLYTIASDKFTQLTTDEGQDLSPYWGDNSTIYFMSARSGKYNIHKMTLSAAGEKSNLEQVTNYTKMGMTSFHFNGADKAVTVVGDKTSIVNINTKAESNVNIDINADYRFDPITKKTYSSNANSYKVSPDGKYAAVVIRGEIFVTTIDKEKSKTVNVSNSAYKDVDVHWLNNETLLFISDRSGTNNIYMARSSDPNNKNIFTSLKHEVKAVTKDSKGVLTFVLSPDNSKIAYIEGSAKLMTAAIDENGKISSKKTLTDGWDRPSYIAWSPDSEWLSYSMSDLYFNDEIYIHKADNSQQAVNVSMHPKSDIGAMWSADGSKLVFSSNRNNGDHDVWFIWLKKADWEKTQQDWDEADDAPKDKGQDKDKDKDKNKEKEKDKKVIVQIDFDKIHERQVQVTSYTGGEYASAVSKDGKTIYYTTGNSGRGNPSVTSDLYQIKWDGKDKKELTKGNSRPGSVSLNTKGDYIYYLSSGRANRIKLAGAKNESLPFSAKMKIDYTEESNQIFEEAWATIRDRFYDPNHHNQDWEKLKATYKPIAMKGSTRADFIRVFNQMLGQINASHMGLYPGENRAEIQRDRTGRIGVEFQPDSKGLKVSHIIPNSAADRQTSKLRVGDVITKVNGEIVSANENIYKYLEDTVNEKILLEVVSNGATKEVVIRPKSSVSADNYNAWVNERKRLTEAYSNGKLGYIHIQGMNWTSFERFERELTAAGHGKDGIVIDVRYNGGGWTTDYLMAVLNVKQHAYTIPRGASNDLSKDHSKFTGYYPFSERLPLAAWTKPSVALCNQNSYSNAEIFSHAYKELELGTLVGIPTFGAVISTGGQGLIDGSFVRVPFRGWYVKSSQKNMDFTPAMPDIVVYDAPDEKAKGVDTQLKRAVDELLNQL